ncbi:SRPBCC domain-containing protein [Asticcacaulis sp. AC402]|uniref:SRPBCC domain-containing protein n=1 Tax=Asticcacaulis sp. AC402 TaxID=1282361 RepID=UPI0003C3C36C|nr:SRPBCC domain-containing protein [Asticcacaulis sp. AC402]ESQ74864.1 hypothetical protein ABAC402_11975 [Asticcacaulis sp. AC402]
MDSPNSDTGFTVINTRYLAFAPEQVFGAFADPAQLLVWWGPHGFTNVVDEFDFRPGGVFRITMTNETGRTFENAKQFLDIEQPRRVVLRHYQPMHDFTMTMLFDADGDGTELTWRMDFVPGSDSAIAEFLQAANEQNFDRLEAFLNGDTHD